MLYTEDFSMRHYVGFSQIGSHMCMVQSHMYIEDISYDYGVHNKHVHSINYTHCIAYMYIYYMYGIYNCRTDTHGSHMIYVHVH